MKIFQRIFLKRPSGDVPDVPASKGHVPPVPSSLPERREICVFMKTSAEGVTAPAVVFRKKKTPLFCSPFLLSFFSRSAVEGKPFEAAVTGRVFLTGPECTKEAVRMVPADHGRAAPERLDADSVLPAQRTVLSCCRAGGLWTPAGTAVFRTGITLHTLLPGPGRL